MFWTRPAVDSLQRRLMLMAAALVILPTFGASLLMIRLTHQAVVADHLDDVEVLAEVIAASLGARGEVTPATAAAAMTALDVDHRAGAVLVTDAAGQVVHRRVLDPDDWIRLEQLLQGGEKALSPLRPQLVDSRSMLAVRKAPIWRGGVADAGSQPYLLGFVVVALHDDGVSTLSRQLQAGQLGVATAVALVVLPPVIIVIRRITRPIRQLTDATGRLASGELDVRVPEQSNDELGALAHSFNVMASHLSAARGALVQANQSLEQRVEQRTAELEDANRRLQSEIDDKNEFLRAVTHDLGAPLRNITGMATLLVMKYREQLAEDAISKLERINANAKHQTELIGELLQLSRIRTRQGKRERIELAGLIQELRDSLAFDLDKSAITFEVHGTLPVIWAEPLRIRQVFQNLLDNAIKYMGEDQHKPRRITLKVAEQPRAWVFQVSDTGCGIAAEDLPSVFQVFRRAVHSGTHKVPGRGVGLASVKSILEAYSGTISVQSTLGEGSTFTVTLPKSAVSERAPEPAESAV
jgi:signal transduction histidine kinase